MYRVVLTDDEKSILEGLERLIEWEELHLQIDCMAGDGEEALGWIGSRGADILITDIKMPGMDGIELIRRARDIDPGLRCLVLSGYDDFPLVREAMRRGAENYLLKPVDQEEMLQNLKEIVMSLDSSNLRSFPSGEGQRLLLNNLMNRIVRSDISHKEFRRKMEFLQIDIYECAFCMLILSRFGWSTADPEQDLRIYRDLRDRIESGGRGIVFQDTGGRPAVLAFIRSPGEQEDVEELLRGFLVEQEQEWCAVGGDLVSSYRELSLSYSQALEGISIARFNPRSGYLAYRDLLKDLNRIRQHFGTVLDALASTSGATDTTGLLMALFAEVPDDIEAELISAQVVSELFKRLDKNSFEPTQAETEDLGQALFSLEENSRLGLERLLSLERGWIRSRKDKGYSRLVDSLVRSVEENYRDYNLSLKSLASLNHVSPEHAGRIFKKETGRFFSDYLSEIRISHACMMLLNTSLPANDIALKTGIINQNYFYTKFKKHTGLNPSEYRRRGGHVLCR